jgi:DNA mismatch repair protein PMS2
MSTAIRAIEKGSVHRITSGQVIVDLQTAVKELLENSFDAGATSVEVRFKEYGLSSIEVVDNGSGIKEKDFESIGTLSWSVSRPQLILVGLKHHTSKLSSFEDLSTILTFGFRGEALSSLCALCQSVVITTCAGGDGVAYKLELARNGQVQSKERVARQV